MFTVATWYPGGSLITWRPAG